MMRTALLLAAFAICLAGCSPERDPSRAVFALDAPDQVELAKLGLAGETRDGVLALHDPARCGDRGTYRLRDEGGVPILLMAPHAFHDTHSGTIAWRLFERMPATAAARNSVPRHTQQPSGDCTPIDLARERDHIFTGFALGFSDRFPRGLVVQIHGFDRQRRDSVRAGEAAVIVSDGTTQPDRFIYDPPIASAAQSSRARCWFSQPRRTNSAGWKMPRLRHYVR